MHSASHSPAASFSAVERGDVAKGKARYAALEPWQGTLVMDAHHVCPSLDLAVHTLQRIVGPDLSPVFGGEGQ